MKRKHLKQALSVTLASTMLLTAVPIGVGAEADIPTATEETAPQVSEEADPTEAPAADPTEAPAADPTEAPAADPTEAPAADPTEAPEADPTETPAADPTTTPAADPTTTPTADPTSAPTTPTPSSSPDASETPTPSTSPVPTVTPAPIEIELAWTDYESEVYDGQSHMPTCTCSTYPDLIFGYTDQDGNEVDPSTETVPGAYKVTAHIVGGGDPSKYVISNDTATYKVSKRTLDVNKDITCNLDFEEYFNGTDTHQSEPVATINTFGQTLSAKYSWENCIYVSKDPYSINVTFSLTPDQQNCFELNSDDKISFEKEAKLTINKLPITVSLTNGAKTSKVCGETDPDIGYTCTINDNVDVDVDNDTIKSWLGKIERVPGSDGNRSEMPGTYDLQLSGSSTTDSNIWDSLNITLPNPFNFTINKVTLSQSATDGLSDYRDTSFTIATDIADEEGETRNSNVEFELRVVGEIAESASGVSCTVTDLSKLIGETSVNLGTGNSHQFKVNQVNTFSKAGVTWQGGIPANTVLKVRLYYKNKPVSDLVSITVPQKKEVSIVNGWSGTEEIGGRNCLKNQNSLSLTVSDSGVGEVLAVTNNGSTTYPTMESKTYSIQNTIEEQEGHPDITISGEFLDTRNLTAASSSLTYYVDTLAQAISSSNIVFSNRDSQIQITLPEEGTVNSVNIPGATVATSSKGIKAAAGETISLPVTISGSQLPATGSEVTVSYTDTAGHDNGTGSTTAARSTISTPIHFSIRPELVADEFLNGRSDTLIINGTGQACEPIRVSIAGSDQSLYITQTATWVEGETGTWTVSVPMSSLPEEEEFTITAEYTDVNGPSESMTATYDAFVASPVAVSPIFEAMSHLSGMVEPNTTVALVVNGDTSNYYEIVPDRFGHFSFNEVPMLFGGEDSFDLYVTDIAGNVSIRHYEIPTPGDPFTVTAQINPLGKFFYSAEEENSTAALATPVSADMFQETTKNAEDDTETTTDIDTVEIPLLFGMSYEIGTMTLQKTANGFTVAKELDLDNVDSANYSITDEKLYVFTQEPSMEDLAKHTNCKEYSYGDEIPMASSGEVWIVGEASMTMLVDDLEELEVLDFDHDKQYEAFQEK